MKTRSTNSIPQANVIVRRKRDYVLRKKDLPSYQRVVSTTQRVSNVIQLIMNFLILRNSGRPLLGHFLLRARPTHKTLPDSSLPSSLCLHIATTILRTINTHITATTLNISYSHRSSPYIHILIVSAESCAHVNTKETILDHHTESREPYKRQRKR